MNSKGGNINRSSYINGYFRNNLLSIKNENMKDKDKMYYLETKKSLQDVQKKIWEFNYAKY